jgi:hypothetical protein
LDRGLMLNCTPTPCDVNALLVTVKGRRADAPDLGWSRAVLGRIDLADLPFSPDSALSEASARRVGAVLADRLRRL